MKPRNVRVALLTLAVLASVAAAAETGSAQRGQAIYERCIGCHSIEGNRTGPQHCGLFGRHAGTAPGFDNYSEAMRHSKIIWDERSLDTFLTNPMKAVPGTAMGYAGIADAGERADLIAWLREATRPGQSCRLSH